MSRMRCTKLIVGSSNIQRFFDPKKQEGIGLIKCVRVEEFRVRMALLAKELEVVAVSVIENFLCDAIGAQPDMSDRASFDRKISAVCQEFVDTIRSCATGLPNTVFLVAKPLSRPRHKWFMEYYDQISSHLLRLIHKLKLKNVELVECLERKDLIFQLDQVHLDKACGERFVRNLVGAINSAARDRESKTADENKDDETDDEDSDEDDDEEYSDWPYFLVHDDGTDYVPDECIKTEKTTDQKENAADMIEGVESMETEASREPGGESGDEPPPKEQVSMTTSTPKGILKTRKEPAIITKSTLINADATVHETSINMSTGTKGRPGRLSFASKTKDWNLDCQTPTESATKRARIWKNQDRDSDEINVLDDGELSQISNIEKTKYKGKAWDALEADEPGAGTSGASGAKASGSGGSGGLNNPNNPNKLVNPSGDRS